MRCSPAPGWSTSSSTSFTITGPTSRRIRSGRRTCATCSLRRSCCGGKHDLSFTVAGAVAYGDDVAEAEVHLLDAGHFALDEAAPQIAELIRGFFAVRRLGTERSAE